MLHVDFVWRLCLLWGVSWESNALAETMVWWGVSSGSPELRGRAPSVLSRPAEAVPQRN